MIKVVIFDYDGVLVNSPEIIWDLRKKYLKQKYGLELSNNDVREVLGLTLEEQVSFLSKKHGISIELKDFLAQRKSLEPLLEEQLKVLPGARELIEDAIKSGFKVAVATSKPRALVTNEMRRLQLNKYFTVIVAKEDTKKQKPDPEPLLQAAKALGARPEECVVIEDAIHGVEAARRAGMKAIGLCNPFNSDFPDAELVVHSLGELTTQRIRKLG